MGENPHFQLSGALPAGWVKLTVVACADVRGRMGVCIDRGKGYSPSNYYLIGMTAPDPSIYQVYIHLDGDIAGIRFDPVDAPCAFQIQDVIVARVLRLEIILRSTVIWFRRIGYRPREIRYAFVRVFSAMQKGGLPGAWRMIVNKFAPITNSYDEWLQLHRTTIDDLRQMGIRAASLESKPLISILMPVYNPREADLREAVESVLAQAYPRWELCIVDDGSTQPYIRPVLEEYQDRDSRIKINRPETNQGIVSASNQALGMSTGDYVALLDHDDLITPDAFFEVVNFLNHHPDTDMLYSDEDKVTEDGIRYMPYFKPDWSPDLIFSHMYTGHLGVYRRSLLDDLGGFRKGCDGAQDWDLVFRLSEKTEKIYHLPKILYSWRCAPGSTAQAAGNKRYAYTAALRVLQDAVDRRNRHGRVEEVEGYPGFFRVAWELVGSPKVSIIICTRDKPDYLDRCLTSIYKKTSYPNFEVIIVDNQSQQKDTFKVYEHWKEREPERFKLLQEDIPFNFSKLNNAGARVATGDLLLFMNNDMEVITPNWLDQMASQGQRPEIGMVGALLLYPNGTIQHAGIVVGINDWAGHSHRGFPAESTGNNGRLLGASNVSAVTGACMLVRRDLFFQVGCLDENLQVAGGDVELCLRVMDAGYRNLMIPDVRLLHYESITRGYEDNPKKRERFLIETEYVRRRWPARMALDPFYNPNLTQEKEDFSLDFKRAL
ncbi:MAG: glycosyltransferase family 2 protein [Anaerolineaceae bacterium]|nr:glycosyltransferase family 2 protein [Anaerolineaceae bacterium]